MCPICNKNSCDSEPLKLSRELLDKHEFTSEYCNPGGRELMVDGKRIQLFDCCTWCDYKTLKDKLEEK